MVLVAHSALAAQDQPQNIERHYDIPAQALDLALARYSQVSGVDVLFREPAGARQRSTAIRGDYTSVEALAALLAGTGLVARFTSGHSAVIVPPERADDPWISEQGPTGAGKALLSLDMMRVTAPRLIGGPAPGRDEAFAQRLVTAIRRVVMERAIFKGGTPADLRIATRISREGALYDVRVVRGSRDAALDGRIVALLEGRGLDLLPPQDLRQPLVFDVSGR